MIKKALVIFLVLALVVGVVAYFMYNKPHQDMAHAKADEKVSAMDLYMAYSTNEDDANVQFLGKVVEVEGEISEINTTDLGHKQIILDTGDMLSRISCELVDDKDHNMEHISVGKKAKIRGKCVGMTMDIILDRCVIL